MLVLYDIGLSRRIQRQLTSVTPPSLLLLLDFSNHFFHDTNMTEEEMKKRLLKTLERDDKRQLNLPFGQDEADDSPHSLLMPDMEEKHAPLSQREFLMGKISQIED